MGVDERNLLVMGVERYIDRPPHPLPMNNFTTTRRTENALEKRRLPVSACLFSLE